MVESRQPRVPRSLADLVSRSYEFEVDALPVRPVSRARLLLGLLQLPDLAVVLDAERAEFVRVLPLPPGEATRSFQRKKQRIASLGRSELCWLLFVSSDRSCLPAATARGWARDRCSPVLTALRRPVVQGTESRVKAGGCGGDSDGLRWPHLDGLGFKRSLQHLIISGVAA
jgi:hypothetical protein